VVLLKISNAAITVAHRNSVPGLTDHGYCVKITNIPEGVSVPQVILLFTHTIKRYVTKYQRYEFEFSELCPLGMPRWS
jgi:hypothetical protein